MTNANALERLRHQFPWPAEPPKVRPYNWSEDAGGRHLVTELIYERQLFTILEIGVFLGGSARKWLNTSPRVCVVGLDRWRDGNWGAYAKSRGRHEIADQLDQPDGLYRTFLATNWDYRDRLIPVRHASPEAIFEIAQLGLQPDLIYLDADKSGREIEICHQLFPAAIISGDDWWWGTDLLWRPDEGYPIRVPVQQFCRRHRQFLKTNLHTWVIDDRPPNLAYHLTRPSYHFKGIRRRIRGLLRTLVGRQERCLPKAA